MITSAQRSPWAQSKYVEIKRLPVRIVCNLHSRPAWPARADGEKSSVRRSRQLALICATAFIARSMNGDVRHLKCMCVFKSASPPPLQVGWGPALGDDAGAVRSLFPLREPAERKVKRPIFRSRFLPWCFFRLAECTFRLRVLPEDASHRFDRKLACKFLRRRGRSGDARIQEVIITADARLINEQPGHGIKLLY